MKIKHLPPTGGPAERPYTERESLLSAVETILFAARCLGDFPDHGDFEEALAEIDLTAERVLRAHAPERLRRVRGEIARLLHMREPVEAAHA